MVTKGERDQEGYIGNLGLTVTYYYILGWAKSSFGFSRKMLQKKLNVRFGQCGIFSILIPCHIYDLKIFFRKDTCIVK